jgi:competence protein ComEC
MAAFHVITYADNGRDPEKAEVRKAHRAAEEHGTSVRVVAPEHPDVSITGSPEVKLTPILPSSWSASCSHDANECSIALRIDFCSSSVLFTGDAEHEEERQLDPHGPVTLLQLGHHGSDTSSSPRFLALAHPSYAVISAGKPGEGLNSDYCHPRSLIVRRLSALLGGPGTKTLKSFEGARCDRAQPGDWVDVPASDHLWATERDGDVVLSTTGDGTFVRE